MADLRVISSRRLALDRSEFEVEVGRGAVGVHELFQFIERGTVWEYVILDVEPMQEFNRFRLRCMNWVPESGAFMGMTTISRPMKAAERKRYGKYLPAA